MMDATEREIWTHMLKGMDSSHGKLFVDRSWLLLAGAHIRELEAEVATLNAERDSVLEQLGEMGRQNMVLETERDGLAAKLVSRTRCTRCNGSGTVDDGRLRTYYETDTAEEHRMTDLFHLIPCPKCGNPSAAEILAAHDESLTSPLRAEIERLETIIADAKNATFGAQWDRFLSEADRIRAKRGVNL